MTKELENYLIKKYPKMYQNVGDQEPFALFGFECDDGWFRILLNLSRCIQNHIDSTNNWAEKYPSEKTKAIEQVKVQQVKEKFGGLRFYYSGGDERIAGMISLAEEICYNTCEFTGATDNVGRNARGWIKTTHESHARLISDFYPVDDPELIEIINEKKKKEKE